MRGNAAVPKGRVWESSAAGAEQMIRVTLGAVSGNGRLALRGSLRVTARDERALPTQSARKHPLKDWPPSLSLASSIPSEVRWNLGPTYCSPVDLGFRGKVPQVACSWLTRRMC